MTATATPERTGIGAHSLSKAESAVLTAASTQMKYEISRDSTSLFAELAAVQPTIGWYTVRVCGTGLLMMFTVDSTYGRVQPAYASDPYLTRRLPEIPCSTAVVNASQDGNAELWAVRSVSGVLMDMDLAWPGLDLGVVEYVVVWSSPTGIGYATVWPNGTLRAPLFGFVI